MMPSESSPSRLSRLASWAPTATKIVSNPSARSPRKREIDAGGLVVADLHSQFLENRHVLIDLRLGQAIGGDGSADHAAGVGVSFEDRDREPGVAERLGGGQTGRTGADDGHPGAGTGLLA